MLPRSLTTPHPSPEGMEILFCDRTHKKGIKSREEQHYPTSDFQKATSRGHACCTHKTPNIRTSRGFPVMFPKWAVAYSHALNT